jgi:hypothetical protein
MDLPLPISKDEIHLLVEYINFWHRSRVCMVTNSSDSVVWQWTGDDKYSSSSANHYQMMGGSEICFSELMANQNS